MGSCFPNPEMATLFINFPDLFTESVNLAIGFDKIAMLITLVLMIILGICYGIQSIKYCLTKRSLEYADDEFLNVRQEIQLVKDGDVFGGE